MSKWLALALASMGEQDPRSSDFPYADSADSADRSAPEIHPKENNELATDLSARAVLQLAAVRSENAYFSPDFRLSDRFEGVPDDWMTGYQRLISMPVPFDLEVARWLQIRTDAERFLEQWGARASALGWSTLHLFGVCPDAPEQRIDLAGLVWLLKGKSVAAMTERVAVIDMGRGIRQSFPWQHRAGQVPIWELPTKQKRTEIARNG